MPAADEKYRRLPGRRRGLINGSSLWLGSDHILLVKTAWFREEYKRFYLRDIQAIVMAPGARFPVSMSGLVITLVWLISGLSMAAWPRSVAIGWIVATVAMFVGWLAISIGAGCRCRLYTAVSKDDLPSLNRTWAVRRFLRKVQPLIEQVQGVVDAGWAEAERTNARPPVAAMAPAETPKRPAAPSHTLASDLFGLSLLVSAIVGLATIRSSAVVWSRVNTGLTLVQLCGAIVVLMQYFRGGLGRAMQRVAIASLVLTGVAFYVQAFSFAFTSVGVAGASSGALFTMRPYTVLNQAIYGMELLLGLISTIITLRGTLRDEPVS